MKKKKLLHGLLTIIMMAATVGFGLMAGACDPDEEVDEVNVTQTSVRFGESGGTMSIGVTSNRKWNVSGGAGWLMVSPSSGSNNGTITLSASANSEKSSRNCLITINAGDASASISVEQSAKEAATKVTFTNNSTYTLARFTLVFWNSRSETLKQRDFGTLYPGNSITDDIPTGATEYWMAFYDSGYYWLSPNYSIEYTSLSLTTAEIGRWQKSSSVNTRNNLPTED